MPTKADNLTPRQRKAIEVLATGSTITEAAKVAKVTRPTVSGWVNHDPDFVAALQAAQADIVSRAHAVLKASTTSAAERLRVEMNNPEATAGERIRAATAILAMFPLDAGGGAFDLESWVRASSMAEIQQAANALPADLQDKLRACTFTERMVLDQVAWLEKVEAEKLRVAQVMREKRAKGLVPNEA